MRIVTRWLHDVRRADVVRGDEGVSLIEVLVALGLLMVLAVSVAAGLMAVQSSALTTKERSAAANLAARELEIVRNAFHSNSLTAATDVMNAGDVTNANPLPGQTGAPVVDNVTYTVKRSVTWLVAGAGQSACDGGSIVSYPSVGVHVEVTWPNMGSIPAVVSDTILTPPKSVLNATSGYLAVKVINRRGNANVGRVISATGPGGTFTDTTGPDGCATFIMTTPGTYTVAVTEAASGYITFNGATSQTATVAASTLTVKSFTYDLGVNYVTTLTPPGGYSLPATLPGVTFGNSGILPAGTAAYASTAGGTTTTGPLWPFVSGYSIWAGSCPDQDPALDPLGRPTAITPRKGSTTPANALLQGVKVTTTRLGSPVSALVTATYAGPGTCAAGDSVITLGTTDSNGEIKSSLPYGLWNLSANIAGVSVPGSIDVSSASPVSAFLNRTT
jgi:Tfp pilus assembly protein PilV